MITELNQQHLALSMYLGSYQYYRLPRPSNCSVTGHLGKCVIYPRSTVHSSFHEFQPL